MGLKARRLDEDSTAAPDCGFAVIEHFPSYHFNAKRWGFAHDELFFVTRVDS